MWSFVAPEEIWHDLRFSRRMLWKSPSFTVTAILSLALGIGFTAAAFSMIDGLLLRPLPYRSPERLFRITGIYPRAAVSALQGRSQLLDISAASAGAEMTMAEHGHSTQVLGSFISTGLLKTLGVTVIRGRGFRREENTPANDNVALISTALWRSRFGSDPGVVGRRVRINGRDREVIGIVGDDFHYPSGQVQVWLPMRLDPANFVEYWGGEFVPLIARLRPGYSVEAGRNEVRGLVSEFRKTFPYPMARDWNASATLISLKEDVTGAVRGKLMILLASVIGVLLIASANVSNLLLSRAAVRQREMSLRTALGAGRMRLVRQLFTESFALSLLGCAGGLLVASVVLSIFKATLPASTSGLAAISINLRVMLLMMVVSLVNGFAFGLAPALSASRIDLASSIRTGGQRATSGKSVRLRKLLIASEVSFTLVLGAGLLVKSLVKLAGGKVGFDPTQAAVMRISPDPASCDGRASCVAFYDRILARAQETSGVQEAAVTNSVPLDGEVPAIPVDVEGHPKTADHPAPMLWFHAVTPGYFSILKIPLLAGRGLVRADGASAAKAVIVSALTARRLWPGEEALGKQLKVAGGRDWFRVVGIVADVHEFSLSQALPAGMAGVAYMPYAQAEGEDGSIPAAMALLVKARGDMANVAAPLERMVQSESSHTATGRVQAVSDVMAQSIADFRSTIQVFVAFAVVSLVIAAIGIYGLVAFWVTQRRYEIGLRMAIGASRSDIVRNVFRQGLELALWGVAAGSVLACFFTNMLSGLLYDVGTLDPFVFVGVLILLVCVAALATVPSAWTASRIDPARSLRSE